MTNPSNIKERNFRFQPPPTCYRLAHFDKDAGKPGKRQNAQWFDADKEQQDTFHSTMQDRVILDSTDHCALAQTETTNKSAMGEEVEDQVGELQPRQPFVPEIYEKMEECPTKQQRNQG